MPIVKITGQGLIAIACSVALLWICLIGERILTRHARQERVRLMLEIERLQRRERQVPVSLPARRLPLPIRSAVG
jgi:hypothetical protein